MSTRRQRDLQQQNQALESNQAGHHQPLSFEMKQTGTINVRFDKRDREALVKQEALDQYQETTYLLGRVFSNEPLQPKHEDSDATAITDDFFKESVQELTTKDLKELQSELPDCELRDVLI